MKLAPRTGQELPGCQDARPSDGEAARGLSDRDSRTIRDRDEIIFGALLPLTLYARGLFHNDPGTV